MSDKFIQTKIWKANEEGNNVTLDVSLNGDVIEKLNGFSSFALIMSKGMSGDKNWNKYVLECIINVLQEMSNNTGPNVKAPYDNPRMSKHDIDIEMLNQLRHVAGTLQYMINSASWDAGECYSFDAIEISRRLKVASNMC